jgi:hypothetical protein
VSTNGCDIHLTWDPSTYKEFEINVISTNDRNAKFQLYTNYQQFIYRATAVDSRYTIMWIPLQANRRRDPQRRENETVVLRGLLLIEVIVFLLCKQYLY